MASINQSPKCTTNAEKECTPEDTGQIKTSVASTKNVQLVEGARFSSFKDLQNFIHKYEEATQQIFVRSNSRSLQNPQVRKTCRQELEYYDICFKCVHGKQQHASQATGLRNSWTSKLNCNAFIKVHASDDGEYLEITKFNAEHNNHKGTEAFYKLLPKNKKLKACQREEIIHLLKLRSNKKFIQDYAREKFDKNLSIKDIHNLASNLIENDDDSLSKAVKILQDVYGAYVAVLHENKTFKGLYFSTKQMRDDMESWPEIVFIDGTYKLLKRNLTVMILLVEDSMGLGKVVGIALLAQEDRPTFEWFLNSFKAEHPTTWLKMQCMMGDKDLNERDVLKEIFPSIPIYICLFHTLRTFGREISREKMNITSGERTKSLEFLNSLAKSSSENQYDATYNKFSNDVPKVVLDYFDKNWHPIKHEWTKYSMVCGNLGNLTNNRLESINSKIKQIVKKHSTMVAFVHSFFKWLNNREHEMLNKLAKNVIKQKNTVYEDGSAEHQYMQHLTSYPFSIVEKEISQHRNITIRKSDNDSKKCVIFAYNKELSVTPVTCECSTWKSMFLPCRHIFAARKLFKLPLFAEELCSDRWKKSYIFQKNLLIRATKLCEHRDANVNNVSLTQCITPKRYLETQKRKLLTTVATDIVHTAMLATESNFRYRLEVLHQIRNFWREGYEVCLTKVDTRKKDPLEVHLPDIDNYNDENNLMSNEEHFPLCAAEIMEKSDAKTHELKQSLQELKIDGEAGSLPDKRGELDKLLLPAPLNRRNRSKHTDITVVKYSHKKKRPISFQNQSQGVQAKVVLQWIISEETILKHALTGEYLIKEADLPSQHGELPDSIMADEVDMSVVEQYMEKSALRKLKNLVQKKKDSGIWICKICTNNLDERSVLCESCLFWHDYKCVNLRRAPKAEQWYCTSCRR